jgi:SH3-like domain-containing protein
VKKIILSYVLISLGVAWAKTSLPIPRFVTLRSSEVNMRVGPDTDYFVDWIYVQAGLPVKIIAEYEIWRQIEDMFGAKGWVHQSMLSGKRNVLIQSPATLYALRTPNAREVAKLAPGVLCKLKSIEQGYCKVQVNDYTGWVEAQHVWGVLVDEG